MAKLKRICIYPKDITRMTGKSNSYARRLLAAIRIHFNKHPKHYITLTEYSEYTGISVDTIEAFLE